jgi:hypothetical protein
MLPSPPLAAVVLPITPGFPPLQIVSPVVLMAPAVNTGLTVMVPLVVAAAQALPVVVTL